MMSLSRTLDRRFLRAEFGLKLLRRITQLKKAIGHAVDLTVPEQELWHLGACDICVPPDTSAGVHQIAHFVNSP